MRSTAFSLLALLASAFAGNTPGSDDSNRHILFASEPDNDELYRDEIINPHNASDISEKPCIDEADSEYLRSFIDANADRITTALNPTCTDIAEYAEGELCDDKHVRQLCCEACHYFDDLNDYEEEAGGGLSTDIVLQTAVSEGASTGHIAYWDLCCTKKKWSSGVPYYRMDDFLVLPGCPECSQPTLRQSSYDENKCVEPYDHRRRAVVERPRPVYDCCGADSCDIGVQNKYKYKMKVGDGDCDYNSDCESNSCGSNNCPVGPGRRRRGTSWDSTDDCCERDTRRRRRNFIDWFFGNSRRGRRAQEMVQPV